MEHEVFIVKYWFNKLFCWHSKQYLDVDISDNGFVAFCGKCERKHTCIYTTGQLF